jgi:signal transduction histidine kinase
MKSGRVRVITAAIVAVVLAAMAVFAVVLADAQRSSRRDIEGRLQDRAMAGATLIGALFRSSGDTGARTYARRYADDVSADALARQARESANVFLLVANADGRTLRALPGTPRRVLDAVAARPSWFRAALKGRIGSSSVRNTALSGVLTFAQPFRGVDGARVLVSGSDPKTVAPLLAGSLRSLPAVDGGRTYLVDADGAVIVSPDTDAAYSRPPGDRGLAAALRSRGSGDLPADRYFAASPIAGVPWRVVLTAPRKELFASVSGVKSWGPWVLFGAFGVASLLALAMALRSARDAARLQDAGLRLAESNAALAERATELSHANGRLRHVNGELERSNAELDRFASIASHDLREPLRKVQMFSERVIHHDGDRLSERGRDYLGRMDRAARRMQTLIDGLLEYARATSPDRPHEEVDLAEVAREVVEDLEGLRRETGGEVVVGDLPRIVADPLGMRRLLQNLIANGLRFHREGVPPLVRVSAAEDGDAVRLVVADDGIGFEPRHAERIFDLFGRLHPRESYAGTGMGLALCRRIVDAHGGSITAEGAPGEGATFTVTLPVAAAPAALPRTAEEPHVAS